MGQGLSQAEQTRSLSSAHPFPCPALRSHPRFQGNHFRPTSCNAHPYYLQSRPLGSSRPRRTGPLCQCWVGGDCPRDWRYTQGGPSPGQGGGWEGNGWWGVRTSTVRCGGAHHPSPQAQKYKLGPHHTLCGLLSAASTSVEPRTPSPAHPFSGRGPCKEVTSSSAVY